MGKSRWTKEQNAAIEAEGCDVLVSAAAGSGKTAVLVERIIKGISQGDSPRDLDRLLVVTFTKAAAAEMSQRIGAAIAGKLEKEPNNLHLQNQMTLLSRADIKTIHAFCLQIIREYYHILAIDPAVRTADTGEIKLLQKEVLEDYFEQLYEEEENQWFFRLLETFGEETGDSRLKELVLSVYEFAQGYPYPQRLLEEMAERFYLKEGDTIDDCPWIGLIQDGIESGVQFSRYLIKEGIKAASGGEFDAYLERLTQEDAALADLEQALKEGGYGQWRRAYIAVDFARLPAYKGDDKEGAERIKTLRTEAKDGMKKLGETYFSYSEEKQGEILRALYPLAQGLSRLVCRFMELFSLAKREKLILDFHDYEHFALEILVEKGSVLGEVRPTEAAKEVGLRYDEIMIDEYQDSNMVQEMILAAVSGEHKGENNRFMVGDVKQSIYRFRLAMPQIFNEKYKTYPSGEGGKRRKIILSKNFRSRKNVLDGINFLFNQMMSEAFGDVEYNEETALYYGGDFPETTLPCGGENELLLVETSVEEDSDLPGELEELDRRRLEAGMIQNKIQALMAGGYHVLEKGSYRPLEYRDIAILLRSMKNWGPVFEDVLTKNGIPFYAETAEGYFDVPEVDTALNLLRLIDNPRQDIPLISILYSPLYDLTADELMQIRLTGGKGRFFDCVQTYLAEGEGAQTKEKLTRFVEDLSRWRLRAREVSLYELIRCVYDESGYYDYVGVTGGGALRQGNLRLLLEKAEQYEKGSRKGLFFFIRSVEDLKTAESEGGTAKLQSEGENLVRVMTIHKSKGLEFPVVFVADCGKQFNEMDLRQAVITHQAHGFGMDWKDLEKRAVYRSLSKTALAEALRLENLSEEMRVLYVALTRAKEKLILTGSVKSLEKSLEKWAMAGMGAKERLPLFRLRRGKNYLDWVVPGLLRHPQGAAAMTGPDMGEGTYLFSHDPSQWQLSFLRREEVLGEAVAKKEKSAAREEAFAAWDATKEYSGRREEVFRILDWKYPYGAATTLPSKVSISEVKRRFTEEITGQTVPREVNFSIEKKEANTLTAAQIGTAMHAVMEGADLRKEYDASSLEELIEEMVKTGRLTAAEKGALRRKELLGFFASPLAARLRKADTIGQERSFAMLVGREELFLEGEGGLEEERVVINGTVDCYFTEGETIILLDYKSDRLYDQEAFCSRYEIQLRLYATALERGLGKKVGEIYIYSFALGRAIPLLAGENKRTDNGCR